MKTALVLGGGGPIGIAWEAGLLLGLRDSGVDLSRADRIVGTSAGSIVGSHLAITGSVEELYAGQATPLGDSLKPPALAPLMAAIMKAKIFTRSVEGLRKSVGKSARSSAIPGEAEWLTAIAGFLPAGAHEGEGWPDRELLLTGIDVETGELTTWTRNTSVPLPLAVAASCAVPCVYPLVQIAGRLYMDGGIGSSINAALATGFDQIVIMDPLARMMGKESPLKAEQRMLEQQGANVIAFTFDDAIDDLIGMNLMDATKRGPVAELARAHGRAAAQQENLRLLHA